MMSKKIYSVAVDGPSGAGKSTLSKAVASELGILYVDTGAIYRTIGYYVFEKGIDPKDAPAVNAILPELDIQMRYGDDGLQRMYLDHYTGNPASKLYTGLGLKYEGILRHNCRKNGVLYDVHLMSMLRDEYEALKEQFPY